MTNVVSAKKRRANRRNARRSTGPRSADAKRRSSQNALKHGILADDVVVRSVAGREQQADFDALLADLHHALRPKNRIEQTLVERIATCHWRLRRVHRFEHGQLRNALESAEKTTRFVHDARLQFDEAMRDFAYQQATLDLLGRAPGQLSPAELDRLDERVTILAKYHKLLSADPDPDSDAVNVHSDALSSRNADLAPQPTPLHLDGPSAANADAPSEALKNRLRAELPRLLREREAKLQRARADLDAAERDAAARCEKASLLASLPESEALTRIVRYENMLDRQLHRALAELRRSRAGRQTHGRRPNRPFPSSRRRRRVPQGGSEP